MSHVFRQLFAHPFSLTNTLFLLSSNRRFYDLPSLGPTHWFARWMLYTILHLTTES